MREKDSESKGASPGTWGRSFVIQPGLRTLALALEAILQTRFDRAELDRLFNDAAGDEGCCDVSEKHYAFSCESGSAVTGTVEEHEPETAWLEADCSESQVRLIEAVVDGYEFAYGPGAGFRPPEESLAIFRRATSRVFEWAGQVPKLKGSP